MTKLDFWVTTTHIEIIYTYIHTRTHRTHTRIHIKDTNLLSINSDVNIFIVLLLFMLLWGHDSPWISCLSVY